MKSFVTSEYLEKFCDKIEEELSDIVYNCDIYGGELGEDATEYLNFNVNKKSQCFISFLNSEPERGLALISEIDFAVFIVTITDRNTKGFSIQGMKNSEKIMKFINESDSIIDGTMGRPKIENHSLINNVKKDKTLYNVFMISYKQRVKQN